MNSTGAHAVQAADRVVPALPGVLIVVPSPDIAPTASVAGIPLLRRIVLAGEAAGYTEILVRAEPEPVPELLQGTCATILKRQARRRRGPARVVVLSGNLVPQARWLSALLEMPLVREQLCVDASMAAVVETNDPARIIEMVGHGKDVPALIADLRGAFFEVTATADPEGRFPLNAPDDIARAESWLLRGLVKQREGFMSRHFERHVSLAITRRLATTRITPNVITVVSGMIGLASAPFFLSSSPRWQLLGSLVLLAHSILDGCDGEIARLKFLKSRFGAALDFWTDNVVHVVLFSAMAIGWSLDTGSRWPLVLGAMAVLATAGAAAVMFRRTAEDRATADTASARMLDALASRDFVYGVILLSLFGKGAWFLVAVAVGTPVFTALAVWLSDRHGRVR